jgi:TetR/AcrR family transcriptional repressor of mexJK operon
MPYEQRPMSSVLPQQERAQQKRRALLESGQALFASRGYEQVTAKEIATHAGVAIGTFYRYFPDKKQLLLTLVEDRLADLLPPEPNFVVSGLQQAIEQMIRAHYARLEELGLNQAVMELIFRDPAVANQWDQVCGRLRANVQERLEQLQRAGMAWPDLPMNMVAWAIFTLVQPGNITVEFQANPAAISQLALLITRLIAPPRAK